jgi:hypothetical protein
MSERSLLTVAIGWDGREKHGVMPRSPNLSLLLEGDTEKSSCLMKTLIGHRVQRVGDVLQPAGGNRHVVGCSGEV